MTMCSIQSTPAVPKIADPQFEKTFAALGDQMKNYYVIDVRPRAIFAAGHIAGSVSVPLDELPAQADHLPRDRDILIYCQRGISCQKAQKFLHDDKHMPHVYFLKEGYEALKNQGLI